PTGLIGGSMSRSLRLLALLGGVMLTDVLLRPLYATGQSTLDLPLVAVLWLALRERVRLVLLAILIVGVVRQVGSSESMGVALVPISAVALSIVLLRGGLNVRDVSTRALWVTLAVALFQTIDITLRWGMWTKAGVLAAAEGAVIAGLSAFVLLPILDVVGPPRRER
ncbi:MAG: hypothetical protein AAF488_13625, partial [Planctomycetota bacterium]